NRPKYAIGDLSHSVTGQTICFSLAGESGDRQTGISDEGLAQIRIAVGGDGSRRLFDPASVRSLRQISDGGSSLCHRASPTRRLMSALGRMANIISTRWLCLFFTRRRSPRTIPRSLFEAIEQTERCGLTHR